MVAPIVDVSGLASEHQGPVLTPRDAGYDTARISFNALIDRHPPVIARAATPQDVVASLQFAQSAGLPVAMRGGGHSVAGHSMCDDGLVIDLRLLNHASVDVEGHRVIAGGGATWRDVDTPCVTRGLVMPGGTFDTTGVAGLTLGGGLGHLMGVHGLTLDHLVSADVVLADGTVTTASASNDPELFWALRGGGGNFGVVTAFEFSLDPLPVVFGGEIHYPDTHLRQGLRLYRDLVEDAPDELTMMAYFREGFLHITVCAIGGNPRSLSAVAALQSNLPIARDRLEMTSYLQIQVMQGDTPFGIRHYWKSQFTDELSDDLIDEIVDHYHARTAGSISSILIEPVHGQATRVPLDATAFGRRAPGFNVSVLGHWRDPAGDDTEISWVRAGAARVAARNPEGGGYLNYAAPDEPQSRVRAAFGVEKYARLLKVKQRVDPENIFRFNHNIRP